MSPDEEAQTSRSTQSLSRFGLLPLLAAFSFVLSLGSAILNPLLPEIARGLEVSVAAAGQLTSVSMLVGALATLVTGTLSDTHGRRPFLVVGFLIQGIAAFGLALASSFPIALGARAFGGLGAVMAVNVALVGDLYEGPRRDRAASRLLAAEALAWIAGVPLMAFLGQIAGWRLGVAAFGAIAVAMALVGMIVLPGGKIARSRDNGIRDKGYRAPGLREIWHEQRGNPDLTLALFANALRNTSWISFLTFVSAYFVQSFGLTVGQGGPILALGALSFIVGTEFGGRIAGRLGVRQLATLACIAAGFLGAVLPLGLDLLISLPILVGYCVFSGMATSALTALILRLSGENRGTTLAINATLGNLGGALGAALGGLAISLSGFAGLGVVVALFALLAALFVRLVPRRV